jgi:hypothetical protein
MDKLSRKKFLKLPIEKHREILEQQSAELVVCEDLEMHGATVKKTKEGILATFPDNRKWLVKVVTDYAEILEESNK